MERLTVDDFFSGLFAALVLKGYVTISLRDERFDRTLAALFQDFSARAQRQGLDVRFRIRAHPIHGDSTTVRHGISDAAQRGVISLDNPEYQDIRIKLDAPRARRLLETMPGGSALFTELAHSFVLQYTAAIS